MVEDLIRRARTRFILNEALSQLAFAAGVFIAGIALVLIVGTRLLEWWALAFFAVAGIVVGVWRIWRALPGQYAVAVRLDENAHLADALSTALYFTSHDSGSAEFQEAQRQQAESAARSVDLGFAVPFTMPRAVYAMAGLAVLASSLFLIRYSMGKVLDLKAPITEVLFEDQAAVKLAKQKQSYMDPLRRSKLEAAESLLAKLGVPINPDEKDTPDAALDKAIQDALDGTGPAGEKGAKGQGASKAEDGKAGNGLDKAADGDPMDGKQSSGSADENPGQTPNGQQGTQGDKGNSKTGSGDNSQSLLSKLKDAVKDMLSKAGKDSKSGGQKSQGQQQQQQASKSDKSGEKGSSGKGEEQQGQQQADAQEGEQDGAAQEGQQAEGKAGSKSAQQSSQAGSGVGSQDGAKDVHAAEQLKAMGKISEIIGKRAATVTGETTIEVQSGNQQLRTAYTDKTAAHGEADSDVSRDEIPVALQSYVQQYFEQVRKPAAPARPKSEP